MQPLMHMALAITLALTGFACAYIGMSKAKNSDEQGTIVLSGMSGVIRTLAWVVTNHCRYFYFDWYGFTQT